MKVVPLPPLDKVRSIPNGQSRKVRITFGDVGEEPNTFLVGAQLATGEDVVGAWGELALGDDKFGITLAEGELMAVLIANQERVAKNVHWTGFMPIVGGSNVHLAGYILNHSGAEHKFVLFAYRVRVLE